MDKNVILIAVGYILYLLISVGMPIKQKNILKNAGENFYSFSHFDKARTVLIYIFSFILIALVSLRFFSFSVKIILDFCAVAGLYISAKESNFTTISGIYKNGIICSEGYFPYDDILTLPILNLPKEEQINYEKNELILATSTKGNVRIVFNDDESAEVAISKIYEICPRLVPEN